MEGDSKAEPSRQLTTSGDLHHRRALFRTVRTFKAYTLPSWGNNTVWESNPLTANLEWKQIVELVMKSNTKATDGSNIEIKESALVWHHQDADPDKLRNSWII